MITISLVINSCDRCDSLRTTLHALRRQTHKDFEVIVVVGPTRDDTLDVLEREFAGEITVVACPQFNLSRSRNLGIAAARGEVVAFLDDDAIPAPTWLSQLARAYTDPSVAGVGGRTYDARTAQGNLQFLAGRFSYLADQKDVVDPFEPQESGRDGWFPRFHGTNMSYRRECLEAVGGFDETYDFLFEEPDVAARIARLGALQLTLDRATVLHIPRTGRNRGKRRFALNWYAWMRGIYYFPLKNARPDPGLFAALRAAALHDFELRRNLETARASGDIAPDLYRAARAAFRRGRLVGLVYGLFRRRRLARVGASTPGPLRAFPTLGPRNVTPVHPLGTPRTVRPHLRPGRVLRVALLSLDYPPRGTHGVARSTHALAHGLAERGHEVHVVTRSELHRVYADKSVLVHELPPPAGTRYRELQAQGLVHVSSWLDHSHGFWSYLDRMRIDFPLDLIDSSLWNLDGFVSCLAGSLPVVVRAVTSMRQISAMHGMLDDDHRLLGDLEEEFLHRAARIVFNSAETRKAIADAYSVDLSRRPHDTVHYGIVPTVTDAEPQPKYGDGVVGLFVGRLELRKGVRDLFAALPLVLAERPDLRMLFVGADNSRHDGFGAETGLTYAEAFRQAHPELETRVSFLGHVSDDELASYYRRCDFLVAPSHYESFGLIYLEAMEHARPVIACDCGGPREIVVDQETGFLVPPASPATLAQSMTRMVADGELRRALGRAGRQRLLARFTHRHMAEGFERLYRAALGECPVPDVLPDQEVVS